MSWLTDIFKRPPTAYRHENLDGLWAIERRGFNGGGAWDWPTEILILRRYVPIKRNIWNKISPPPVCRFASGDWQIKKEMFRTTPHHRVYLWRFTSPFGS